MKDTTTFSVHGLTINHAGTGIQTVINNEGVAFHKVEHGTKLYVFKNIVDAALYERQWSDRHGEFAHPGSCNSFSHTEVNPEALAAPDLLADLAAREHNRPVKGE